MAILASKWDFKRDLIFKKGTGEFLGRVALRHGDKPGQADLDYLFKKNHWGKGFAKEAVTAVVKEYAPAMVMEGYTLGGKVLEKITATVRTDNPASVKILDELGMHDIKTQEKYGALRYHFSIDLSGIVKRV